MRCDEETNPLDDNERKILISGAIELLRLKQGNEFSSKSKYIWCPPNDSSIKAVNPSFKKHSKHLGMRGVPCLEEPFDRFVKWPESVRRKRSSNQLSVTFKNMLGSVQLGKRQKGLREKIESLPNEVIEEFLSRLPVKSFARFRCVCKSWYDLSHGKRFIYLHIKNYRTSQLLVGTCTVLDKRCSMYFLPPPPPTGGYSDNGVVFGKMEKQTLVGGSCNGIVCMYSHHADVDIVLWNPVTNEVKKIRNFVFPDKWKPIKFYYCTVRFGFDPKTNDYKILRMVYGGSNPLVVQTEIYSLHKDSWTKVDSHDFLVVRNTVVLCSLPFTDHRIVCAIVSPLKGTSKWEILCFDMSSEMYEIIPMPPSIDAELGDHHNFRYRNIYFRLFPFKESIAIGIVHSADAGKRSYCNIWVLNGGFNTTSNATHKESRSWSKFMSTDKNDSFTVPVGCWGGSQIIFQEILCGRLFRLDLGCNMMVDLGVFPPPRATAIQYKESLLRIKDVHDVHDGWMSL